MRSRKILTAMLVGLLLASVFGPAVALGDTFSTDYTECTLQDWWEWLLEFLIWIFAGRPDGPPVPNCG